MTCASRRLGAGFALQVRTLYSGVAAIPLIRLAEFLGILRQED